MSKKTAKDMVAKYEALEEKFRDLESAHKRSTAFSKMLERDLERSNSDKMSLTSILTEFEKNGQNASLIAELRDSHTASASRVLQLQIENLKLRSAKDSAEEFVILYKRDCDTLKGELGSARADLKQTTANLEKETSLLAAERLSNEKAIQLVQKEASKLQSELCKARKSLAKSRCPKQSVSDAMTSTEPPPTKIDKPTDTAGLDWGESTETQFSFFVDDSLHPVRSAIDRYQQDTLKAKRALDERLRPRRWADF